MEKIKTIAEMRNRNNGFKANYKNVLETKKTTRDYLVVPLVAISIFGLATVVANAIHNGAESKYKAKADKVQSIIIEIEHKHKELEVAKRERSSARIDLARLKIGSTDDTKEIKRLANVIEQEELFLKKTVRK